MKRWLWPLMYLHPGARGEADGSVSHQPSPRPGAKLLDVGCGDGDHLDRMRELGWNVFGVETDGAAAAAAIKRGLPVHIGELASLPNTENFDVVTVRHVVEHVLDPANLLHECRRVLKPGGTLVVMTPNAASVGHALLRKSWLPLDPPRHIYLFTRRTLRLTLDRSGNWVIGSLASTLRGSGGDLLGSLKILIRHRHHATSAFEASLLSQMAIHFLYYMEWLAVKGRPSAGEELCLIATKPLEAGPR
jgi:SAM-dependent methyltransferase